MSSTPEQQIRERAYHLWLLDGCPHERADEHWFSAERQVLALASTPMKAKKRAATKTVETLELSKPTRSTSKRQNTPAAALAS